MRVAVFTFVVLYAPPILALPSFADSLPNANNPELAVDERPCKICHVSSGGGGDRNRFGEDFEEIGSWPLLFSIDSDRDGQSNGFELGDPDGVWTPGDTPERTVGLSFPGDPTSRSIIVASDAGAAPPDSGSTDAGSSPVDAGAPPPDSGINPADAGAVDAGPPDAGPGDSGIADVGVSSPDYPEVICACARIPSNTDLLPFVAVVFGGLMIALRGRRC